ncbi:MAG TPA: thermonuclease family protein [Candidatus Saccharimonadales bacterium]|nr:thermonuclease family protein [Candidatus Saccharimonadales bacterium]
MARRRLFSRRTSSVIAAVVVLAFTFAQTQGWLDSAGQEAAKNQPGLYSVSRFVDGDTIAVDMNGRSETVRMIGVDTPETHKPNTPVQCYGPAAAAYTKNLIGKNKVRLESDETNQNRDRYGRLLRYVYLPDGRLLEKEIISSGYGFAYTSFPFIKKADFVRDEQQAKEANRGLWRNCTVTEDNGRKQTNVE